MRKIARHYNKSGPDGLKDHRKDNGHELLVSKEDVEKLAKRLEARPDDGGLWTGPKVAKWIEKETNIKVSNVTGWSYLTMLALTGFPFKYLAQNISNQRLQKSRQPIKKTPK